MRVLKQLSLAKKKIAFNKLLLLLLIMKHILTPHILPQCDTQLLNNNGVPGAETPLGSSFHSADTFLCCSVNGRQDLIFHTSSKQHSLVRETFILH